MTKAGDPPVLSIYFATLQSVVIKLHICLVSAGSLPLLPVTIRLITLLLSATADSKCLVWTVARRTLNNTFESPQLQPSLR